VANVTQLSTHQPWRVVGSYFEVCNCEAICPCRRQAGRKGGRPIYPTCDFALSWWITDGQAGAIDLAGLKVVMAGRWDNRPDNPWHVTLYVDARATPPQRRALEALFLGREGGPISRGYAANIIEVHAVKSADIELDHTPARERIAVPPFLTVRTREAVGHDFTVTCGIPGHEHPGQEIRAETFRYRDGDYDWDFRGKCGFYTNFDYSS
jgi:hypothetical protein